MLSGTRTGKKKKSKASQSESGDASPAQPPSPPKKRDADGNANLSVAEQLRRQLASGKAPSRLGRVTTQSVSLPFERLQQEGRIEKQLASNEADGDNPNVVVLSAAAGEPTRPDYRPEDFRLGTRKGKVKRSYADAAGTLTEDADSSIQEMVQEERNSKQSMDEVFARNVARVGSRYKATDFKHSSATGADEEDMVDMKMFQQQHLTKHARHQKERARQVAQHDRERDITSRCWWWMDSKAFRKHMLVALGNYVSLVMAPSHLSLVPGDHLYLVPIPHSDSLVTCEDDVWNEIHRFQQNLRDMYKQEDKAVVFTETVLPSSKGFWQTRLECMAVPVRGSEDAAMYFKTALTEQAEEWGTHTKLMQTRDKGLRRTIPKAFPYFFVEWESNRGYAQIIESSSFPKELGQDTLAGMLDMEPVRFRRRQSQSADHERKLVLDFVTKWKPFDWTLQLE